jgi:serine/threonine-protein kinase
LSFGQEEGNLFFAMELVRGNSLHGEQKAGRVFGWPDVLEIALQTALGLRHAHERGITHRDLKPGNLLLDECGLVKITDFGIAKIFGGSHITGDGNVVGTIDFMSPEQALGRPVSARSDLYGLGAVTYMLLARRPPFVSTSIEEAVRNLTAGTPLPIASFVADIPREFAQLIHQLLDRDPQRRGGTALAVSHRLREMRDRLAEAAQADTHVMPVDSSAAEDYVVQRAPAPTPSPAARASVAPISVTRADSTTPTREIAVPVAPDEAPVEPAAPARVSLGERQPEPDAAAALPNRADFFNVVTDQVRKRIEGTAEPEAAPPGRSLTTWSLVAGFAAVLLLAAAGVWYATRPPSAEKLLSVIDASSRRPNHVLEEIDQFLLQYPDHPRVPHVRDLRTIGAAHRIFNTLSARARVSGLSSLSLREQELLAIEDLGRTDLFAAHEKLVAWIAIHSGPTARDAGDELSLAANGMLLQLREDVERQQFEARQSISDAVDRAKELVETDAVAARQVLESIIKTYGEFYWAGDLVDQARDHLDDFNARDDGS